VNRLLSIGLLGFVEMTQIKLLPLVGPSFKISINGRLRP
jgi:hypothetical protein